MSEIVAYLPLVLGLLFFSFTKKYKATTTLLAVVCAVVAHVLISVQAHAPLFQIIAQPIVAIVIFFATLSLLGAKTNGSTVATLTLIMGTIPLPIDLLYTVFFLVGGIVINGFVSVYKVKRTMKEEGIDTTFYIVLLSMIADSGVLGSTLITENIPERHTVQSRDKVNYAQGFAVSSVLLLIPLFL